MNLYKKLAITAAVATAIVQSVSAKVVVDFVQDGPHVKMIFSGTFDRRGMTPVTSDDQPTVAKIGLNAVYSRSVRADIYSGGTPHDVNIAPGAVNDSHVNIYADFGFDNGRLFVPTGSGPIYTLPSGVWANNYAQFRNKIIADLGVHNIAQGTVLYSNGTTDSIVMGTISPATPAMFTYEVVDGSSIRITNYGDAVTGDVVIPAEIEGLPVTSIGYSSFSGCSSLTSVTIPRGVTSIGNYSFSGCSSLTSVTIPSGVTSIGYSSFSGCSSLTSVTISLGVTSIDSGAFRNCSGLTNVTIPSSVTSIDVGAFSGCSSLVSITIPSGVTSIGSGAFSGCNSLTSITIPSGVTSIAEETFFNCSNLTSTYFMGDAPTLRFLSYSGTHEDHKFYYLSNSTGFTSPTWHGYPTQMIDTATYPAAEWLLASDLPYETNLNQDLNGDEVTLLMAYALDLNPNEMLTNSLPVAEVGSDSFSMGFYGNSEGVTYRVETSQDLKTWVTDDVTISDPDGNGVRTASVPLANTCGFLKLVVVED